MVTATLVSFFVLALLRNPVNAARILVLTPTGTKSHTSGFEPLYHALGARGHEVTIVTNFVPSTPVKNMRYIKNYDVSEVISAIGNPFQSRLNGKALNCFDVPEVYEFFCRKTFDVPAVMGLTQEDFDLVIINSFMNECSYGLAAQFPRAKVMLFSTLPLLSWVSSIFGNPVLPSHTPVLSSTYGEVMTFVERLDNFALTVYSYYMRNYRYVPRMEALYKHYFPMAPTVEDFEKKIDFVLINSHPLINYPRALLPNMVETSGLQCQEGKPLPKDLEDFIRGAGDYGVVYFSMGSFLQGTDLPERYRLAFLHAFAQLKQRVIWKFETESMPDLPPNVKLGKWFPQQDILAHPSIKLFITHGGLLSLQEAVFHGVPLLGIPLFGDQDSNLAQSSQRGFSLTLNIEEIDEPLVTSRITHILTHDSFRSKAQEASVVYRDRLQSPIEIGIFWTEYLLRTNDTSHLHSAGRDLSAVAYHSIDVIALIGGAIAITLYTFYVVVKVMKWIFGMIFGRGAATPGKKIKKN